MRELMTRHPRDRRATPSWRRGVRPTRSSWLRSLGALDLLVTDVIMPGMSGHELAIKLGERQPGLRTLYVSGYAGEALARSGGIDRSERFLQKPFSERGLLDSVAAALSDEAPSDDE